MGGAGRVNSLPFKDGFTIGVGNDGGATTRDCPYGKWRIVER